jgi:tRNA threonylcarbamoyladenosine biosynthesis protein TsaB
VTVLGFDTATAATTVCVLRGDGEAFERDPGPEELARPPAHATELLPRVARAMEAAEVDWGDVERIAVGVGPGSFTGLRVGIATARALAHARELPLHPVSSLAALAEGIDAPARLPLIDARRGELFAALFEDGELRWKPFVTDPDRLVERVRDAGCNPLAAGDGSLQFRQVLESGGIEVAPTGAQAHVVRALHVCRLAGAAPARPPEAVVPLYLRAPDAKPQR